MRQRRKPRSVILDDGLGQGCSVLYSVNGVCEAFILLGLTAVAASLQIETQSGVPHTITSTMAIFPILTSLSHPSETGTMTSTLPPTATADSLIKSFSLTPHPEGGFFRETQRSTHLVNPDTTTSSSPSRAASTSILYLLPKPHFSSLHRIDADETWYFHCSSSLDTFLEVVELTSSGPRITKLGLGFDMGQVLQYTVEKGTWFGARLGKGAGEGSWVLVGCAVAPGFVEEGFEMGKRGELMREWIQCEGVVREMTRE